jgi:integrase
MVHLLGPLRDDSGSSQPVSEVPLRRLWAAQLQAGNPYQVGQSVYALNWALEMELIHRNPFAKMRSRGRPQRRRPMTDDEFQTLLQGSDPTFRRFLIFLKFTGCRPGEAASMRWPDVHFEEGVVVLKEHKTARKTGRTRVIPLVPTVIKLLLWIRSPRQHSSNGREQDHVFTNSRSNTFSRGLLSLKMQRFRKRLGLAQDVTLYGLRHRYGLMGIKNGVNLKLLSLCMGHARTQMTEHYIAEAGLRDQVQQAALQVAYGHRRLGVAKPRPSGDDG